MACQNIIEVRTMSENNFKSAKCAETSDDTLHNSLRLGPFPVILESCFHELRRDFLF